MRSQRGGHHKVIEFSRRGEEPKSEVQIYTWMDATLRRGPLAVEEGHCRGGSGQAPRSPPPPLRVADVCPDSRSSPNAPSQGDHGAAAGRAPLGTAPERGPGLRKHLPGQGRGSLRICKRLLTRGSPQAAPNEGWIRSLRVCSEG